MTGSAIAMMIIICALVWGGFLTVFSVVWRIEKRKKTKNRAS
ncbi:MAG: MetS family NSS transporter small subunit [bacterium]|nr:MAG: MetS family NSS transporter small subunit [bacterium]